VGLGANLGDSAASLARACQALAALSDLCLDALSSVYRTEPQGFREQPWFHNQVARLLCGASWTPLALLDALLQLEQHLGRERGGPRFGPRSIDLDLLLFGDSVLQDARLRLPHPRMRERAFVLVPLREIAPDLVFPDGQSIAQAIDRLAFQVEKTAIRQSAEKTAG
jgi:2-amino-4-hydroxy-6-hydroxymethyldihydropteridine diphosphokinase